LLALESASIQNPSMPEIVWTLRGLAPGETQVKLVSIGGFIPIVTSRTIQVVITPSVKLPRPAAWDMDARPVAEHGGSSHD